MWEEQFSYKFPSYCMMLRSCLWLLNDVMFAGCCEDMNRFHHVWELLLAETVLAGTFGASFSHTEKLCGRACVN